MKPLATHVETEIISSATLTGKSMDLSDLQITPLTYDYPSIASNGMTQEADNIKAVSLGTNCQH